MSWKLHLLFYYRPSIYLMKLIKCLLAAILFYTLFIINGIGFTANTNKLYIGTLEDGTHPYWFNGVIDEIRIYSRDLPYGAVVALNNLKEIHGWLLTFLNFFF